MKDSVDRLDFWSGILAILTSYLSFFGTLLQMTGLLESNATGGACLQERPPSSSRHAGIVILIAARGDAPSGRNLSLAPERN